jgi:hypothetical protein
MITIRSVCLACLVLVHTEELSRGEETGEKVYGEKGASTIAVRITGDGIRKPGLYHLPSGASVRDLMDKAIWLRFSNGRATIRRIVDGKKVSNERNREQWDTKLLDGDDIFAGSLKIEKAP